MLQSKIGQMGLIVVAALLSVAGQVYLKIGIDRIPHAGDLGVVGLTAASLRQWAIYAGLLLYGVSMVLYLKLLSVAELSYVGLGMSLGFVFLVVGSRIALGEPITTAKVVGGALIMAGVVVINW